MRFQMAIARLPPGMTGVGWPWEPARDDARDGSRPSAAAFLWAGFSGAMLALLALGVRVIALAA